MDGNYKSRIKILSFRSTKKSKQFKDIFIWIFGRFRLASSVHLLCSLVKRWSGKDIQRTWNISHEMWENHFRLFGSGMFGFMGPTEPFPWLFMALPSSFLISSIFHFHINSNQGFWLQNCVKEKGKFQEFPHAFERRRRKREKNGHNKSRNCTMFFIARDSVNTHNDNSESGVMKTLWCGSIN